jgi:hypothetical protein
VVPVIARAAVQGNLNCFAGLITGAAFFNEELKLRMKN